MEIFDTMVANNGEAVSKMILDGRCVNVKNSSGISLIQVAGARYCRDCAVAHGANGGLKQVAENWARTLDPVVQTNKLEITKVHPDCLPTILDRDVDRMLHELGYIESDLAASCGYLRKIDRKDSVGEG